MPPGASRQERQLQRQRGAARRTVQDTSGFDLVIPDQDDALLETARSGQVQSTPRPKHPPPKASKVAPVSNPVLGGQPSSIRTPDTNSSPTSRRGLQRIPSSIAIGKRKRPTGEAVFDLPDSPILEPIVDARLAEPDTEVNIDERPDDDDLPAVEQDDGTSNILESMEVNGTAVQKAGVRKRKKRKSIGQQANKRVKTKAPPVQRKTAAKVKPESMSPAAQLEGSSRLDVYPAADDQAQQETSTMAEARLLGLDDPEDHEEQEENGAETFNEDEPEDEDSEEIEHKNDEIKANIHLDRKLPTAQMQPPPSKRQRKKRKSIGQQKPKRPSTSRPAIPSPTTTNPRPKQPKPKTSKPPLQPSPDPELQITKPRPPPANSVPITIYRPAPSPSPPTSNASSADLDPLTAPLPPLQTTTITPIDVLSQLTRELVDKTATNTALSGRARRAIDMYGQELEARMKQLGQAFGANKGLGQRLRAVNAEGRRVKGELVEVESEREGVKEKVDEARRLEKGVRLGGLMDRIAGVVRKGWDWERERDREESGE